MVDRATARLQEIAAQVVAGQPMTVQQQEYVREFTEVAGPGALAALAVLAPTGAQEGVKRARAAVATSLSAFTDPNMRAVTDDTPLPDALRILLEDPFTPLFDEPATGSSQAVAYRAAQYEAMSKLLAESAVPVGAEFGEAAGRRALEVSQAATELLNAAPLYTYGQDPAVMAAIEKAGRSAAVVMTAVSRNLDAAQALVGDRDFRHGLLLTRHLDDSGAAALLDRATARIAPTAADAEQNAEIVRDLFDDLAGDPYGWREEIPKGSKISDTLAMTAAEHIDAFSRSDTGSKTEVRPPAETTNGFLSKLELGGRDAEDVLTFVAAGREPGKPDHDLIALHAAAQAYTSHQVQLATAGELDPSTAMTRAGTVTSAVNTADLRSAVQAYESVDSARSAAYENASTVAGVPLGRAVEFAAGAAPGWVGDALSTVVDKAVAGFEPEATAGAESQKALNDVAGRQELDINHLIVSAYQAAGALPADTPDLDAVTDHTGQVAPLDSFRDDQPDPDVIGNDLSSESALEQIARNGPAGGNQLDWKAALSAYAEAASLDDIDVDHANPEPRTPLDPALVDSARRGERHEDPIPWPLANPMTLPSDTSTPVR
jgi:hypothetical protein